MALDQSKQCPIVKVYLQKFMNEVFECRNDYVAMTTREKIAGTLFSTKGITVY